MSERNVAADQLRLFIERIERLEEEKKGIGDDIKDVYSEAKATGFDVKAMRQIVRLRKLDPHERQEQEALLGTYKAALGMDDMFAGHDGRVEAAARNFAHNLNDLDAKAIGVSIAVGDGEMTPLNKTARKAKAERVVH